MPSEPAANDDGAEDFELHKRGTVPSERGANDDGAEDFELHRKSTTTG